MNVNKRRPATVRKRSRNGCLSCKKLHIKCDESRPKCEYCEHTGRECIYRVASSDNSRFGKKSAREALEANRRAAVQLFDQYMNGLSLSMSINANTKILGISTFELKLLEYFDKYCIPLLSYGVDAKVEEIWRHKVPPLFVRSALVKKSVFLFSCLNMWSLYDMGLEDSTGRDEMTVELALRSEASKYLRTIMLEHLPIDNPGREIFTITSEYFSGALRDSFQSVSAISASNFSFFNDSILLDSVVSGVLINAFLVMHPHRLLPLVSFDENPHDILAFSKGLKYTILSIRAAKFKSEFSVFIRDYPLYMKKVTMKIYVIKHLEQQLAICYDELVVDAKLETEKEALASAINILAFSIAKVINMRYPVPMVKWLILFDDSVRELIRNKHFFAMRLLYVFCCLAIALNLRFFKTSNIFTDYIKWFREYNLDQFSKWQFSFDEKLYLLVIEENFQFDQELLEDLQDFDPEAKYCLVRGQKTKP